MPTSVKLGSIQGYALASTSVATKVGAIQGYALVRTPNLPNFALDGKATLLAAMNKQYKSAFTLTQVSFGAPQALTNDPDYNTTTLLTTNRTSGYSGTKTLRYNRVDLAYAIAGKDTAIPTTGMGSTVWTSLAAINTKFGLVLTTADVVDKTISGTGLTIFAADTSVLFTPGTSMRLGSAIPAMTAVFNKVEMDNPLTITTGNSALDTLKALFLSTVSAAGAGLTVADFVMEEPVTITGVKNTSVKLNTNNAALVTGSQTLRYDRKSLDTLAPLFSGDLSIAGGSTVHDLLTRINNMTGIVLEARDLVNNSLDGVGGTITLVASASSYAFIPGTTLALGTGLPSLSSVAPVKNLDGFRLDTLAEACSVTNLDGFDAA